jgi:protein-disulfide isomerase
MDISLLYFDDCPNWKIADERLAAIAAERTGLTVRRHVVATLEEAERLGFRGSPSILVNGVDVFAEPDAGVGLSCRVYRTPDGLAGVPTVQQLRAALEGEKASF